jgi:hypothetical protein
VVWKGLRGIAEEMAGRRRGRRENGARKAIVAVRIELKLILSGRVRWPGGRELPASYC